MSGEDVRAWEREERLRSTAIGLGVAPSPAAAGLPLEDVERVARALWEGLPDSSYGRKPWADLSRSTHYLYRTMAAAALAEMRPTAAGPDPQGASEPGPELEREADAPTPVAAAPDPRFHGQLAEMLESLTTTVDGVPTRVLTADLGLTADALMPAIAAEVEARVQAAANQRPTAAEEAVKRVEALADELEREATVTAVRAGVPPLDFARLWRDDAPARIRAALAAPVPPDANGGEER